MATGSDRSAPWIATIFGWLFRDRRTGRITIVQFPNLPLWLYVGTVALRRLPLSGRANDAVRGAGVVALLWWATDELVRGVNPFRRVLGLLGVVGAGSAAFALLR